VTLVHAREQDRLEVKQRYLNLMAFQLLTDITSSTAGNLTFGIRLILYVIINFTIICGETAASIVIYDEILNSTVIFEGFLRNIDR
jgi:hypothetical protein